MADGEVPTDIVLDKLKELSASGFDDTDVKAALQTVEIRTRRGLAETRNVGVELLMSVAGAWVHGRDVFSEIEMSKSFELLRQRIANREPVFQDLIKRCFVDNPHRVDVTFTPDPELAAAESEAQAAFLQTLLRGKSNSELRQIADQTQALASLEEVEDSPEDISKIPILKISDLDAGVEEIEQEVVTLASSLEHAPTLLLHPQPTADVMYATLALNITSDVSEEDVGLLGLLQIAVNNLGTAELSPKEFDQKISLQSGGVHLGFAVESPQHGDNQDDPFIMLEISGSALRETVPEMFALLLDMLESPGLNQPDAVEIMQREVRLAVSRARQTLQDDPFSVAESRARAQLKPDAWIREQMGGAHFLELLEQWQKLLELPEGWNKLKTDLYALLNSILGEPQIVLTLVADRQMLEDFRPDALALLQRVESAASAAERTVQRGPWTTTMRRQHEALVTHSGYNMLVYGAMMPKGYEFSGSADAVSALLDAHLVSKVRTNGGAFGSWMTMGNDGYVAFKSYVDPNLEETVKVFDESPRYLYQFADDLRSQERETREAHERELVEAVIVAMRDHYPHLSPVQKGSLAYRRFLRDTSYEMLQKWKLQLLQTSHSDIRDFADALEGTKPTLVAAISNATSAMLVSGLLGKIQFDSIVTDLFL